MRCLRTHGVLLGSVARTTPADQREQLSATAARLLLSALPAVPDRGAQEPRVNLLAPHVIALLRRTANWAPSQSTVEAAAKCALRLVTAVHRAGDYASALSLGSEAVELVTPRLGASHVLAIRLRQRVARALFRLGRFEESEALYLRMLEDCERTLGPTAPETLQTCLKLAGPLFNLGRRPSNTQHDFGTTRSIRGGYRARGEPCRKPNQGTRPNSSVDTFYQGPPLGTISTPPEKRLRTANRHPH
ncbi:tetratricopeptide repeat protein [Streptomyces sp. NPDC059590]|uniref:tetratricopeptide repeat protein n=1 Tax=Streptomyces sp. NPDC059590 TaxID=3346877 RepID=UPI0036CDDE92